MRILVITYSFFPRLSARAFRWTSIAKDWAEKGIKVDVVCSGEKYLNDKELKNIKIYRVNPVVDKFKKTDNQKKDETLNQNKSIISYFKMKIVNLLKSVFNFFRWPDGNGFWIYPAYKKSKLLLRENKYDAVVSVALPFSSHVVALLLKLKKRNINWITDFGDPFSVNDITFNNDILYKRFNKIIERKIINKSKKVSVTTKETVDEYVEKLKVNRDLFYVMPPMFDKDYLEIYRNQIDNREEELNTIKVLYTGAFHRGIREPNYILSVFSLLQKLKLSKKIELHIYGKLNDCKEIFKDKYNNTDWLFLHGEVSKKELMKVYKESDVLLNIGNQTTYQVPSKIIEYMSTGLPILNFISIEEDLSKKVLTKYSNSKTVFEQEIITEDFLKTISTFLIKQEMLSEKDVDEIIEKYSVNKISAQYLNLIN